MSKVRREYLTHVSERTEHRIRRVAEMLRSGATHADIMRAFGCAKSTASNYMLKARSLAQRVRVEGEAEASPPEPAHPQHPGDLEEVRQLLSGVRTTVEELREALLGASSQPRSGDLPPTVIRHLLQQVVDALGVHATCEELDLSREVVRRFVRDSGPSAIPRVDLEELERLQVAVRFLGLALDEDHLDRARALIRAHHRARLAEVAESRRGDG